MFRTSQRYALRNKHFKDVLQLELELEDNDVLQLELEDVLQLLQEEIDNTTL